MNPFDRPPTSPPVSFDPPEGTGAGGSAGPRRGRMALVALATAGLVGGGIVVAGQFASADEPTLQTADEGSTLARPVSADETAVDEHDVTADDRADDDPSNDGASDDRELRRRGEIVIDDGDGDPIVLDLDGLDGDVFACLGLPFPGGEAGDGPAWPRRGPLFDEDFEQRMEEFLDGLPLDEMGDLGSMLDDGVRIFGSGGSTVTVVGPDGVQVIDLGEGDATVTIEQRDGELSVTTDGDAELGELPDFGELFPFDPEELPDFAELFPFDPEELPDFAELFPFDPEELPDFAELFPFDPEELPDFAELFPFDPEELPDFAELFPFDPERIQSCLDEAADDTAEE